MSFSDVFYYLGSFYLFSMIFLFFNLSISGVLFSLVFTLALFIYKYNEEKNNKSKTRKERKKKA